MADITKDIATVFGDAYSRACPKVLGDQHQFLLNTLETYFRDKPIGKLLIAGPGGQVLPYSCVYTYDGRFGDTNRDRIKSMIKQGNVVLMDCVCESERNGLFKGIITLTKMGFFEECYFQIGEVHTGQTHLEDLKDNSISFLQNNLRDPLRIDNSSFDAIDANLSVHHASVTRAELKRVYSEFHRILKTGGLLHLGEGKTDMNYSEDKIIRIGTDLSEILGAPVLVLDDREKGSNYQILAFFEPSRRYNDLPVVPRDFLPSQKYASVRITEDGLVNIKATSPNQVQLVSGISNEVANALNHLGYAQTVVFSDSIIMPLIDPKMHSDINGQIEHVDNYYDNITNKVALGYAGIDAQLIAQVSAGIEFERGNARRGTVEYYMSEKTIVDTLNRVGFRDIKVTHHKLEPFYNVVAIK